MSLKKINQILYKYKYVFLLIGLVQHLFIGVILSDLEFYANTVWGLNMIVLAIGSTGIFIEKGKWKNLFKNFIFLIVIILPIFFTVYSDSIIFISIVFSAYFLFFGFIFYEIITFLIRPSYINIDIITASACGFLLLLELSTFLVQLFVFLDHDSFNGINSDNPAATFVDVVYFCTIMLTTIGFGDITPNSSNAKLVVSLIGWIGQFYSVFLVGILVGKFSSITFTKKDKPISKE